jgi:drug/metabolite transporter (DMT)-like permease
MSNTNNNYIAIKEDNDSDLNLRKARYYRLYTVLLFTLTNFLFKLITVNWNIDYMYHSISLRFGFMALISYYYITHYEKEEISNLIDFKGKHAYIIIRCLMVILTMVFFTLSLFYVKVGVASCLNMTTPIFQNILSYLLLRESFNLKYIYVCLISLVGVYLLVFDTSSESIGNNTIIGVILSLLCSISNAFVYIVTKFLQDSFTTQNLNYLTSFWIMIFGLFYSLIVYSELNYLYYDILFILLHIIIGLCSFYCYHFLGLCLKYADVSKTSYITYAQLPLISILGLIFYNEIFTLSEFTGVLIIISSVLYASFYIK